MSEFVLSFPDNFAESETTETSLYQPIDRGPVREVDGGDVLQIAALPFAAAAVIVAVGYCVRNLRQ